MTVDDVMCDSLTIVADDIQSPFREYILPLSYQNEGLLCALLSLAACHQRNMGVAVEYKLPAIQSLSAFLSKEELVGLDDGEEVVALAIVLLLIIHDVRFESFHLIQKKKKS